VLLARSGQERRLFVTRDKDFGGLVFVEHLGKGVIYLRISPSTVQATHQELKRVLQAHTESEVAKAFIVVEPGQHRFRKLE
jgi:predicted nuclease of predicted toxin-antitoxin system